MITRFSSTSESDDPDPEEGGQVSDGNEPDFGNGGQYGGNRGGDDGIDCTDALRAVIWGARTHYTVDPAVPEVPIDPVRLAQIMSLTRQPLVRRLLLFVHFTVCQNGALRGHFSEQLLAARLWAGPCRPDNWRTTLRAVIARAAQIPDAPELIDQGDRIMFTVAPEFLGSLSALVQNDTQLVLVTRNPDPERRVSVKQLRYLRDHGMEADGSEKPYRDNDLRRIVRDYRKQFADIPTLGRIARMERPYRTIFVPALLGQESVCRELGDLVNLLVDNHTRWHHEVTAGQITGGGKAGQEFVCPMLDPEAEYDVFAGNGGGRGYRAATWARQLGTSEASFLNRLANARERLGLIPVGVDRQNNSYDLDAIAGSVALRDIANVRIYTAKGFRQRWAAVFGWQGNPVPATTSTAVTSVAPSAPQTDRRILRERVLLAGLRKAADAVGVDAGHLSRYLKRGRGLAAAAVARLRQQIQAEPALTPELATELLAGCETLRDFAVAYRKLGWCVVPLAPGTRMGHVRWKEFQTALPTEEQVHRWWTMWPDASIGILLGPISGLLVVDTDSPEAEAIAQELLGDVLDRCPRVMSGSREPGHGHYYFRCPDVPSRAKNTDLHPSLEIRGTGGLIIAPPSLHATSGQTYAWVEGQAIWQVPLLDAPPQIVEVLVAAQGRRAESKATARVIRCTGSGGFSSDFSQWRGVGVPKPVAAFLRGEYARAGGWNDRIFNAARWCRDHAVPANLAARVLVAGAGPVDSGNTDKALRTIRSAYSRPAAG